MSIQINGFHGEYRWLSNFWPSVVKDEFGIVYQTIEAAYQAAKSSDPQVRSEIAALPTPGATKKAGRKVPLPIDWESRKVGIIEDFLRQKFAHHDLREKLLATGDAVLVEANTWNDTFWGVCNGVGQNQLGLSLMKIRSEIINN